NLSGGLHLPFGKLCFFALDQKTVVLSLMLWLKLGVASIYAYSSTRTASGERTNHSRLTAVHRTLAFSTRVAIYLFLNRKAVDFIPVYPPNEFLAFNRAHTVTLCPHGSVRPS